MLYKYRHTTGSDPAKDECMKPRDALPAACFCAAVLFLTGCIPDNPEAPEWELTLTVPLMNERMVLFDELEGEEGFYVDTLDIGGVPTPVLGYSFETELDPVELIDYIKIEDQESVPTIYQPSDFEIHIDPGTLLVDIPFILLWPEAALHHGDMYPVPPIPLVELLDAPAGRFSDYRWADIMEGGFTVRADNDLPFDLDVCDLNVKDDDGNSLPEYNLGPLPENGSSDESKSIEDQKLTNVLLLDFAAASNSGSGGVPVMIDTTASVSLQLHYDEFMTLFGAEIRAYRFDNTLETIHRIATDSVLIEELVFADGLMEVTVYNTLEFDVGADITLSEFTKEGEPLVRQGVFPSYEEEVLFYDLPGVTFAPSTPPPTPDSMDIIAVVEFTALIEDTSFVTIEQLHGDRVSVSYSLSGAEFTSFAGEVLNSRPMDEERTEPGFGEDIPPFTFEYFGLSLGADNETGFSPGLSLSLSGLDENGAVLAEADLPPFIVPAEVKDEIVLDIRNDPSIMAVFNARPDTIVFTGRIDAGEGDVSAGEKLQTRIILSVPLVLALESDTLDSDEPDDIAFDEETRDAIEEYAISLAAHFSIESYLPVGARAACYFAEDSSAVMASPDLRLPVQAGDYFTIEPGQLDENGLVTAPSFSTWEIELDLDQLMVLTLEPLYFMNRIIISGTGGETVVVRSDDYIGVSAYLSAEARTPFND